MSILDNRPRDEYGAPIPDFSGLCFTPENWDGPSLGPWWDDLRAKALIEEAFKEENEESSNA